MKYRLETIDGIPSIITKCCICGNFISFSQGDYVTTLELKGKYVYNCEHCKSDVQYEVDKRGKTMWCSPINRAPVAKGVEMKDREFITYEIAEAIAVKAHEGQTRRGGEAYISHPLVVASMMTNPTDKIVAILHDVPEDNPKYKVEFNSTRIHNSDIHKEVMGHVLISPDSSFVRLPTEVAVALNLLTHKKSMTYQEYIAELSCNPIACRVKIADIVSNMADSPTERQRGKYLLAMRTLLEDRG